MFFLYGDYIFTPFIQQSWSIYSSSWKCIALPGRHAFQALLLLENLQDTGRLRFAQGLQNSHKPKIEKTIPFVGGHRLRVLPAGPARCPSHPALAPWPRSRPSDTESACWRCACPRWRSEMGILRVQNLLSGATLLSLAAPRAVPSPK